MARSFEDELEAYRPRLAGDEAALRLLDRWIENPSAEEVWTVLGKALPAEAMPTPEEFIFLVLERWERAREARDRAPHLSAIAAKIDARTKLHIKQGRHDQIAKDNARLAELKKRHKRLIGRKHLHAERRIFMQGWTEKFVELCGRPLDEVTRVLTDVCFDCSINLDTVRRASKRRRANNRRIRPPK
jgi:hypothetical protein